MKDQLEYLKQLAKDPDDFSGLPDAINTLETYFEEHQTQQTQWAETEQSYQEKFQKLQESNRALISQIPIKGAEPPDTNDTVPTKEDVSTALINSLKGAI